MKKVLAFALAFLLLFPATGFAFPKLYDLEIPIGTTEMVIPCGMYFRTQLVDEEGNKIESTWENAEQKILWGNPSKGCNAVQPGKNTLIATTENGDTHEIEFEVPEVYVSVEEMPSDGKITIEEHKAIVIAYQANYNGITTVGTKGDSVNVTVLHQKDIRPIQYPLYYNMCEDMTVMRLMPAKAGDYKIIIKANGKTVKTITVTVKKSAVQ